MTSTQSAQNSTILETASEFDEIQEQFSTPQATHIQRHCQLDERYLGQRFDQIAAQLWDDFSREKIKSWISDGVLKINGQHVKPKNRSEGNETLTLDVKLEAQLFNQPENIALNIVYEDDAILVINKPVGMVVHPGAGNPSGTLVNALLYHYPQSRELARAGLVHRIDKDTSGLLVIAKTLEAQHALTRQLASKSVYRVYDLVCYGHIIAGGTVDAPIKRHPVERTKMAVVNGGKPAVTHYNVLQRFEYFSLVQAQLETGRTHQIRVHFAHMGHPLVGDQTYARLKLPKSIGIELTQYLQQLKRQALHARCLGLIHPVTGEEMRFEAEWPEDFSRLVQLLQQDAQSKGE
ncbi:23S rRNA pseudouridine(1911/1915/1917) synthase RluD [Acinetobacter qingfengensis]|uniref:Pseudouridine synthase n=1 Tax=Acinetobacter qingfengensis TaxID=1262585 RepID=A0A1E7RFN1_9GAMM|nr:23S rRNA pseudouridine(1911/1915/1917) synthase RluD [Acinetobacter qingfengensis]KAA8732817.1 23S rRNA pseudouridine(1911/1915/1917) synthase RluD [Acinetobacter qingfengensis]OEY98072.1 RNA pseudouridine synthase [Acinetobacter qingfengensis]